MNIRDILAGKFRIIYVIVRIDFRCRIKSFAPSHFRYMFMDEAVLLKIYVNGFVEVEWRNRSEYLDAGLFPFSPIDMPRYDDLGIDYSDWVNFKIEGSGILL